MVSDIHLLLEVILFKVIPGILQKYVVFKAPTPAAGQAPYGSYPWQAALLTTGDVYLGSGVLLNNLNVLTVAHRASPYL